MRLPSTEKMFRLFMYPHTSYYSLHHLARLARPCTQPKSAPWARMNAGKGTESYRDPPAAQSQPQLPAYIRQISGNGCTITVHAKPGAKVAGLTVSEGRLNVAVQAQPQDGKANEAVVEYLASVLDIRKRCISLTIGGKSRDKVLKIEGIGGTTAASAIAKALQD